jgi:formylglycine-generating enzyme required for sulfatase activity
VRIPKSKVIAIVLTFGAAGALPGAEHGFVDLPAGSFALGCVSGDDQCRQEEAPQRRVSVAAFRMARHEVTVAEFRRFVEASQYRTDAERGTNDPPGCFAENAPGISNHDWKVLPDRNWRNPGFPQGDDEPVVCVTWNDARAYVTWAAKASGRKLRLPTEAEWEYAARAGSTAVRPWGDSPDEACKHANVFDLTSRRAHDLREWDQAHHGCEDGYDRTAPVGQFAPNAFGLYDMIGNVWEWTSSCAARYPLQGPDAGREEDCSRHVHRGAAWFSSPKFARSSKRYADPNDSAAFSVGFRLAEDVP